MSKITFIQTETKDGLTEHAIIDLGNDEFISMPKSTYDEQQAALAEQTKPTK